MYFTGIDIGTTSTKGVVFDISGKVLAQKSVAYEMFHPKPNWSEQNPDEIYTAVTECLAFLDKRSLLETLSFSSAMHSIMAVDIDGNPLTNLIVWADNRAIEIGNTLKKSELGQEIYQNTGTPIHPFSFLCKILWLKTNQPEIFEKTHKFIGIKEYVWYKLFGHYEIDTSLASATGMMNIKGLCWDKKALTLVGITEEKLPKIVPTTFSRTINSLNYFIGAADGPLANLGTGAMGKSKLAFTMGTSGAVRICVDEYYTDPQMRTFNYLLSDNQHVIGGATNNGAVVIQWLKEQILQTLTSTEELIENAEKTPAGAENLLFLPYILGERAPVWNADAKGVFFGLSINHTQAHLTRAVMEGLILNLYSVGKVLMEKFPVDEICASGGFAKSDFWLQLVADIFQKKVVVLDNVEGSAWGAVLIAMKALNIEPKHTIENNEKAFFPNQKNGQTYTVLHAKFERVYEKLKDEF
ncbi:gluconokinase [Emticicia sp. SJ17W-69]|uniref:gluconokinase n=1 Tax=Emticicia sp. SJ17W-69 TaxID=3421657 RepID=UPI003EBDF6C8